MTYEAYKPRKIGLIGLIGLNSELREGLNQQIDFSNLSIWINNIASISEFEVTKNSQAGKRIIDSNRAKILGKLDELKGPKLDALLTRHKEGKPEETLERMLTSAGFDLSPFKNSNRPPQGPNPQLL